MTNHCHSNITNSSTDSFRSINSNRHNSTTHSNNLSKTFDETLNSSLSVIDIGNLTILNSSLSIIDIGNLTTTSTYAPKNLTNLESRIKKDFTPSPQNHKQEVLEKTQIVTPVASAAGVSSEFQSAETFKKPINIIRKPNMPPPNIIPETKHFPENSFDGDLPQPSEKYTLLQENFNQSQISINENKNFLQDINQINQMLDQDENKIITGHHHNYSSSGNQSTGSAFTNSDYESTEDSFYVRADNTLMNENNLSHCRDIHDQQFKNNLDLENYLNNRCKQDLGDISLGMISTSDSRYTATLDVTEKSIDLSINPDTGYVNPPKKKSNFDLNSARTNEQIDSFQVTEENDLTAVNDQTQKTITNAENPDSLSKYFRPSQTATSTCKIDETITPVRPQKHEITNLMKDLTKMSISKLENVSTIGEIHHKLRQKNEMVTKAETASSNSGSNVKVENLSFEHDFQDKTTDLTQISKRLSTPPVSSGKNRIYENK